MADATSAWSRRGLLGRLAAGLAIAALRPARALAFGDDAKAHVAELDLGPGTVARPTAWRRMLSEVTMATSVECDLRAVPRVRPEDPSLFEHPFLVLVAERGFAMPSQEGVAQLTRYLDYGGFLFIDDASGSDGSGVDAAARALMRVIYPTRPLVPLAPEHPVFRSFFLIGTPVGRTDRHKVLEGITTGTTTPVMYFRDDLSGALERDALGRERPMGDPSLRYGAVKLSINLMMYALTSNYKQDQAHVAELLRNQRLEGFWK